MNPDFSTKDLSPHRTPPGPLRGGALLLALCLWSTPAAAQTQDPLQSFGAPRPAFDVFPSYETGDAIAEQLRRQPPKLYEFDRASLRDTLRFLADDAGIPFVSLPESEQAEQTLVTFTMRTSAFRALEIVAKANGVSLFFEHGVWYMRPYDDQELVGRTYKLKYFPQDKVRYDPAEQAQTPATAAGGGAGIADIGLNQRAMVDVFEVEAPEIIDEIRELLGIPTQGLHATTTPETTVDDFSQPIPGHSRIDPGATRLQDPREVGDAGARVIYNSDTDTVFILATRQQHQWVESLLASIDRPQALVGIEVKFVETRRDPRKELGVDWSQTFGPEVGGYGITLGDMRATADLRRVLDPTGLLPLTGETTYAATLTADDINVRLRAFLEDRDTSLVQYPRVLTLNNREVIIRSVINQPVLASTASVTPGIGGTTTASVAYLPIGTIMNILPKIMPDDSVVLNVAVVISNIVGFETLVDSRYPIASSRVYNAALQVDSGHTLAIGGLEEAFDETRREGIPFFRDIPLVGALFRAQFERRDRKNLLLFITPTTIRDRATLRHIRSVSTTAVMVLGEIEKLKPQHPAMAERLEADQEYLDDIIRDLNRVLGRARSNRMEF